MAIPASTIVSVNPRVLQAGGSDLEINGLLLTRNANIPLASTVMEFTSASAVGEYLGTDSWEYIAAAKYFGGYTNCFAYPRRLMIARYLDEDAGAEIKGAKYDGKLGDLQAITDGVLELMYNGTAYKFTGIDFSGAATYSDVAGVLEAAIAEQLTGVTVSYSSLTGGYSINAEYVADTDNELEAVEYEEDTDDSDPDGDNPDDENPDDDGDGNGGDDGGDTNPDDENPDGDGNDGGDTEPDDENPDGGNDGDGNDDDESNSGVQTASIKPLAADDEVVNDLAVILSLLATDGAINSAGHAAMNVDDNFKAIREKTDNWVTFTTVWAATDEEHMAFAQWAMAQGVQYLYVAWSAEKALEVQGEETSIAYQFDENNVSSVALVYKDSDTAMFVMSCAASIDWNRYQGAITFAFKTQDGLEPTVTNETIADVLLSKRCNFYGQYATRNDDHIFLYDGSMYGDYRYIDPYINAIWLNNALQEAIMNGLKAAGRVPYTDRGYTLIRSWMADPISRALYNGVIDEGVTLSEAQKQEVYNETGREISDELYANGYVVIIEDADPTVRVNRESPNISLYYCYGGSVHKIVVASTALL